MTDIFIEATDTICKQLRLLASNNGLINPFITKHQILKEITLESVKSAYRSGKCNYFILTQELLGLWFASLFQAVEHSGHPWSHFWDLDIKVDKILRDALGLEEQGDILDPRNRERGDRFYEYVSVEASSDS